MIVKHLIGKQVLELEVGSSENTYAIQQEMSELVWRDLVPELNKMFDRIVGDDTVISLDKIELNIGNINLNKHEDHTEIVDRIVNHLEEVIKDKLKNLSSGSNFKNLKNKENPFSKSKKGLNYRGESQSQKNKERSTQDFENEYLERNYLYQSKKISGDDDDVLKKNVQHSSRVHNFYLWLHWLEKGVLPSYTVQPNDDWIELVLETLGLDINAVLLLEKKIVKHPIVLERLVLQHSAKNLKSIVELYTAYSQTELLEAFKEIELLLKETSVKTKSINYRKLEISIWKFIFKKVISERKKMDSNALIKEVVKLPIFNILKSELQEGTSVEESKIKFPYLQRVLKETTVQVPKKENKRAETKEEHNKKKNSTSSFINKADKKGLEKKNSSIKEESEAFKKEKTSEHKLEDVDNYFEGNDIKNKKLLLEGKEMETPQFFKNAGIVLLHPFISHFFGKLNLLEGKEFKNYQCQSKAVLLLHFLATGEEEPSEYEMVLPKFLCEMPANMPIDHTLSINKEELEEANNVLQAAIDHWGALKGSSPEGLQEGFLMREGKLEKEQVGWKLYVEQKTLDILLDQLPWNLSIIKLPWMQELLKVEWR